MFANQKSIRVSFHISFEENIFENFYPSSLKKYDVTSFTPSPLRKYFYTYVQNAVSTYVTHQRCPCETRTEI